jgi:hypothetical protein
MLPYSTNKIQVLGLTARNAGPWQSQFGDIFVFIVPIPTYADGT